MPLMTPLTDKGFHILNDIYTSDETSQIINTIEQADKSSPTFRKTQDLFAIRRFLQEVPAVQPLIFNAALRSVITDYFGQDYFVVKSIYFDKPAGSNWFVAWHQDLTISVNQRKDIPGFGPWTVKPGQFAVQPPPDILENIFTIRIHLDDTDEHNGALRVIHGSHHKGIYRPEFIDWIQEKEVTCKVGQGGVMFMRPLLLHASSRSTDQRKRRVIHIECSNRELPEGLEWAERISLYTQHSY